MSHSHLPSSPFAAVSVVPTQKDFDERIPSLKNVLPSVHSQVLSADLSRELQKFNSVIGMTVSHDERHDGFCQAILWKQMKDKGLILSLAQALGHKAIVDAEASVIRQFVSALTTAISAGIRSKYLFSDGRLREDNTDTIRVISEGIPNAIAAWWTRHQREFSGRSSKKDLAILESLVRLGGLANQMVERGREQGARPHDGELSALSELESKMKASESLYAGIIEFIGLQDFPADSESTPVALDTFCSVFRMGLPSPQDSAEWKRGMEILLRNILVSRSPVDRLTRSRYFSIVNMIYITMSSPQRDAYLQSAESPPGEQSCPDESEALARVISDGYWECLDDKRDRMDDIETAKLSIRALVITSYLMSISLRASVVSLHILERSFIPLVINGLLAWQLYGGKALESSNSIEDYDWQKELQVNLSVVGDGLRRGTSDRPEAVGRTLRFAETIDILQTASDLGPDVRADGPLDAWEQFNHQPASEKGSAAPGCAWTRCPLFNTETLERREHLYCGHCETVQYCNKYCQER
ncbi:hypothetical protein FRB90_002723 [Tulasnella sp. 427]|nr:hypothetical protein FRB90_002723 [Tulasnella sp. 427]